MIQTDRRRFLGWASGAGLALAAGAAWAEPAPDLKFMTGGVVPISPAERQARIARAQALMRAKGISALLMEPGSSLIYFTGVHWSRSERMTACVIPAEGEVLIVTPHFEEPSVRETLAIPGEVRIWQEDENPLAVVAGWLTEKKLAGGVIGVEETVRFFIVDALQKALPSATLRNGAAVTRGVRMIKTEHELALMQLASDITIAAYRHTYPRVQAGMTRGDIDAIMAGATRALGGEVEFNLILLGEAAAYPHGSGKPQIVREGEVVLMDCGCTVQGYQSDISRTFVFGEPTAAQRKVWNQVHRGQEIALAAAQLGAPAGSVDDAVRAYYESLGYGPRYDLPGLSHRTGHGIGLDGHEPVNLVHGETTPLAAGMCFSNEPGIYIPGGFGVRLEDCFHMTEAGPKWFSVPPPSIDKPFG
ncbi:Xaa-Pro peptidase family protein [Phenylobacterium aquaticum]|uniref:M24 family metallopeptidase n=1 Tax=Phenylobacterium aquaticum TaxID=1763816 RepID=UPI0026EA649C|nr:Xaa-Pro peptidase family protein [Phenylobacterium aquaticum]